MRIMGIDYGTKKIGIALSDEERRIAFPKAVLPNDWMKIEPYFNEAQTKDGVSDVVLGLPVGLDSKETELSREVRNFAEKLKRLGFSVYFENEVYSSAAVKTAAGVAQPKDIDAQAAAVVLQSFLDRERRKS